MVVLATAGLGRCRRVFETPLNGDPSDAEPFGANAGGKVDHTATARMSFARPSLRSAVRSSSSFSKRRIRTCPFNLLLKPRSGPSALLGVQGLAPGPAPEGLEPVGSIKQFGVYEVPHIVTNIDNIRHDVQSQGHGIPKRPYV